MEVTAATIEREQPFRDARGDGAIVFDGARLRQATQEWLDPEHWDNRAEPVRDGGRGAAWFVSGTFGDAVLRRYRRGGVAARLSRDRYLWLGRDRVRSAAEFRLLGQLRAAGLPVPAPLVAGWWRRGAFYRQAILIERIPGARSLASWLPGRVAEAPWAAVGRTLARFHRHRLDHADLNAHNILVDGNGAVWLIDLDRGVLRDADGAWREGNLDRLQRSLAKIAGGDERWRDGWRMLHAAYAGAVRELPP
jgi:3-deoxy-D-manno-octulosonic acid kinase